MNKRLLDLKKLKFELKNVMRYNDVGDYFDNTIIAYDFKNDIVTNAIFLHEFIEYTLIKSSGIETTLIDKFDTDPTSAKQYPEQFALYEKYHDMANMIEKQFIENLGLNWEDHDKTINTAKVKTAVQNISDELHKENPNETTIEESKQVVKDVLED